MSKVLYLSLSLTPSYMKTYFCKYLAPRKHDGCGIMPQLHRETQEQDMQGEGKGH